MLKETGWNIYDLRVQIRTLFEDSAQLTYFLTIISTLF